MRVAVLSKRPAPIPMDGSEPVTVADIVVVDLNGAPRWCELCRTLHGENEPCEWELLEATAKARGERQQAERIRTWEAAR
jgi:hypothetical protein